MDRLSLNIKPRAKADSPLVTEKRVQSAVCRFIDETYKGTIYVSSPMGLKMTVGMAKEVKSHNSHVGLPDMLILAPKGEWCGLAIELKTNFSKIYKLDGTLKTIPHIRQQAKMLRELQSKGYYAVFGCGLKDCQQIIREYMEL